MEGNEIAALVAGLHETMSMKRLPPSRHLTHVSSLLFCESVTWKRFRTRKNSEGESIFKNI